MLWRARVLQKYEGGGFADELEEWLGELGRENDVLQVAVTVVGPGIVLAVAGMILIPTHTVDVSEIIAQHYESLA